MVRYCLFPLKEYPFAGWPCNESYIYYSLKALGQKKSLNPEHSLTHPCISRLLPASEWLVAELSTVPLEADLKSCPHPRRKRRRPAARVSGTDGGRKGWLSFPVLQLSPQVTVIVRSFLLESLQSS